MVNPIKSKTKLACILEASESTRMRMGESLPNYHEDHVAGKGCQLTATLHYGTQIYSKAAVDKEWKNWKRFRRGS